MPLLILAVPIVIVRVPVAVPLDVMMLLHKASDGWFVVFRPLTSTFGVGVPLGEVQLASLLSVAKNSSNPALFTPVVRPVEDAVALEVLASHAEFVSSGETERMHPE